jgi:LPXTG-motif cell wall-anchored protein
VSNSFEIYKDADGNPDTVKTLGEENVNYNDYAFLHSRETTIGVGESQNVVHDYQVTPGMYYIRENPDSIQKTITDTSGQEWQYKATEIQTEWVWREGDYITQDDKGRLTKVHKSDTYTGKDSDTYNAIPDVLGSYKNNEGGDEFNGFLEFYVINKYEKVQGDIPEPSQDSMNIQLDKKWDDNGDTDEPDGDASVPFTLHQVKKTTVEGSGSGQASGIKVVLYDTNGTSVLATGYANVDDTLSLSFTTNGGYKDGHIQIKNIVSSWGQSTPTWKNIGSYPVTGYTQKDYVQTDANGNISQNMSYVVKEADVFDGQISFKLSDGSSLSGNFSSAPTWVGANGSGGSSSQTTTEVDPEGSGYPKTINLSNTAGWSYIFQNLPTKETIPAENKTIEYSYYLVEGTPTGSAADFTSPEYKVYLDEEGTQQDEKDASDANNAITGSGITKYVEVTNKKATLTVKKEWLGEEETDAYPPIKFKLYQGVKSGNGVNAGQEYTAETNVPKDANGYYTISAESGWQVEFTNLPTTMDDNGMPVDVGYYVQEFDPGDGTNWFSKVTVSYMSSTGNSGTSPQAGGIADNNGTLTIINKLPTYAQITIIKQWFENNNGSWNNVSGDASKTSNYAFGFIVQRKVEVLDANDQKTGEVFDFEDYGSEIVVSQDKVLVNDNEFNVESQGSIWQYRIQGSGDINRHENDLVKTGYYEKEDGSKVWAEFSYRFMETNAYDLSTVVSGETVKDRSEWQTLPWNPKYENSGTQTTISNYPIGEIDVTKIWENEDPDLEIGSKVYFKVYRDDVDITSDIVEHPANYGLYSNQVFTDGNVAHDSIMLTYDGTKWETIRVQGLPILTENSSQYQYKIREIGYSDRANNDFWDVSTFLQGYIVDNGSLTNPDTQGKSQAVNSAAPFNTVTIENKYIKTETEYEFTKVWQDPFGDGTGWQAPITVTLYQTKGDVAAGTDTPTGKTATFTINPYGIDEQGQPISREFTFDGKTYEWSMIVSHEGAYYTFGIEHLPYKDGNDVLSYYVTENSLGGYLTSYAFKANEDDPDLTIKTSTTNQEKNNRALDGQYIINKQPGVELPATGGPGTRLFTILGSILVMFAGVMLWRRRRTI